MALIDNIVSVWKFNESSGNAADSVDSNTLVNQGTATFSAGKFDNATNLALASSQYFKISSNIRPATNWTVNSWINTTDTANSYRGVFAHFLAANTVYCGGCWYRAAPAGGFDFFVYSALNATNNTVSFNTTLSTGEWHMVTCVYDISNTKLQFYLDGTQ